jgi:Flp pilus assembly pilin Flp
MMKAKSTLNRFLKDQSGEGFLDVAMKILIVVVIGAAVLAIMDTAMPNLFQGLIDKISTELTGIDIVA